MSKYDIYLLENSKVLKNKLGINNEAALDVDFQNHIKNNNFLE